MKGKLLTVVVPVYNTEHYLRRCLDSVLCGEIADALEVIAVNDGSTDASPALLRDYAARWPGCFVLIDRENGGHGAAVNAGLAAATGRYVRVLDSDDWLDTPGFLRLMSRLGDCREDLIVTPYTQEYAESGAEVPWDYPYLEDGQVCTMEDVDWREGMNYFTLASSVWRTELLRASGLRLPEKCSYVDMIYNLWPIPYVRSLRYFNIPVYRYFLGRPGQSMEPAVMRRQLPMHEAVLFRLASYYDAVSSTLPPGARRYMELMLFYMLHTHCSLLAALPRRQAFLAVRRFDRALRELSPELGALGARVPYLRFARLFGYRGLLLLDRRAFSLLSRLRRRAEGPA